MSKASEATCKTNKYASAVGVGYTDLNWCLMIPTRNTMLPMQSEEEMRKPRDGFLGQGDAEMVSE